MNRKPFLILLCAAVYTLSYSQSPELTALYQKKVTALSQGDVDNAVLWGKQATEKAYEEFGESEMYANYASDYAQLLMQLKQYEESLPLFERVHKIYVQKLGSDHVYTAVTNNNLGNLYRFVGKNDLAAQAYKQALNGYAKALGPKHEYYSMTLNSFIDLCNQAEFNNELEAIYRTQRTYASANGTANIEYVAWTNNLAMVLEKTGKVAEAEKLYLECLDIVEKNKSDYKANYPTLNANLGQFYMAQNRLDEAERYMLRSIDPTHETYATHLNNLAMVQDKKGQSVKALENYLKSLQHLEQTHLDTSSTYRMIVYNVVSSYSRAARYRDEILLIRSTLKRFGKNDARLLNDMAIAYERLAEYKRADSLYEVLINKPALIANRSTLESTRSIAGRADVWRIQGKLKDAEGLLLREIRSLEKDSISNRNSLASLNHNLAYLYKTMGQFNKAEALSHKAIRQHVAINGKDVEYANMIKNEGSLYIDMVQYERAEALIKEAMKIERKEIGEQHDAYSTSLNQLGLVYYYQGRYNDSKVMIQESLKIKEALLGKNHEHYANGLVNLANVYLEEGLPEKADPLYKQAERIYRNTSGEQTRNYANVLQLLSKVKGTLGLYKEAEDLLLKSIQIHEAVVGRDHPDYSNAVNSLGMLYSLMGRYDKADSAYTVSLEIRRKAEGSQGYSFAQSLNNIAELYMYNGRPADAEKMYQECLSIAERTVGKQHPDYASYLNNLGQAKFKSKKFEEAKTILEKAIALRENVLGKTHLLTLEAKSNLLVVLEAMGKPKEAEKIFLFLNDQYLEFIFTKFPHLTDKEKAAFYSTVNYHFESFQSFALRRQKENPSITGDLFDIQLATKALLLNSSKKVRESLNASQDPKQRSVYAEWLAKREYLAKTYSLAETEINARHIDIKKIENEADSLERQLSQTLPAFDRTYRNSKTSWRDIKKNLKPGEAAIEMSRFYLFNNAWIDSIYYGAFVIKTTSEFPEIVVMPNGKAMENRLLKYYRAAIRSRIDDKRSWDNFWSPIHARLANTRKIYFSPDGVYNEINLNTLTDSLGVALLDKMSIHVVTSTKEVIPAKTEKQSSRKVVLLGRPSYKIQVSGLDAGTRGESETSRSARWLGEASFADLPGTQKEVEEIAALVRKSAPVEVYLGEQAREEIIKKSSDVGILHVATHGFFIPGQSNEFEAYSKNQDNASDPMLRSGIVLAGVENFQRGGIPANSEDGILTAMEISNLQLDKTELVVMSACETGLGEVRHGEGVYGLQRAFRIAGAKAMIMSLWKVDDEATKEMMIAFYGHWLKTSDKRKSFELAQQEIRKKYNYPYYWGAFVLLAE